MPGSMRSQFFSPKVQIILDGDDDNSNDDVGGVILDIIRLIEDIDVRSSKPHRCDVEQTMMADEADYKNDLVEEQGRGEPVPICNFPPAAAAPRLHCNQNKKALRDDLLGHHLL